MIIIISTSDDLFGNDYFYFDFSFSTLHISAHGHDDGFERESKKNAVANGIIKQNVQMNQFHSFKSGDDDCEDGGMCIL